MSDQSTAQEALLTMLKEDGKVVLYRPRLSRMCGTTSAILLQQMYYRYNGKPFYKLKAPCSSRLYTVGDSWCEELGFLPGEFDTALRRISTKCTKGKNKTELLAKCPDIPQPVATETKRQYIKRLSKALKYLIIFWTDSDHVTWYSLNRDLFAKLLIAIYIDKLDCAIHGLNGESQFIFIIEPKRADKETDSPSPKSSDGGTQLMVCIICQEEMKLAGGGITCSDMSVQHIVWCDSCANWLQTLNRDDCDSSASDVQLTANMAEVLERLAANEGLLSSHQDCLPALRDLKMVTEVLYHNKAKGYYWAITDKGRAALEAYQAQQKPTMTETQFDMLTNMEDHGVDNAGNWAYKDAPRANILALSDMGYCKLLLEANEWVATDTGRGALEANRKGCETQQPDKWTLVEWQPQFNGVECSECGGIIRRLPGAKKVEFYAIGELQLEPTCVGCFNSNDELSENIEQQKPTMTELANEILVPTPEDSSGPEQLCPACKIGQCLIDDVSDKTRCNECDTEFDVHRNCSILDHGGSCGDCDIQGDCEIENGNCVLFRRSEPEQLPEMSESEANELMQSLDEHYRTDCMYMYQGAGCRRLRETTATCVGCERFVLASDTPLNDQADAMLAIKDKMKAKHKCKSKSKKSEADKMAEANMWEAVKFVWELDDKAGGLIGKYRQWLFGKIPASKAKQFGEMWYGNQLKDCPATAQEVVAFSHWYRFTKPGMSMPGKGDTLKDNLDAFRGSGKDYEAFLRKAEDTIRDKIPKFSSPGIELARGQVQPEEEEEIMEATPELRAEVDRLIAMCGKGGVK